MAAEDWQRQAAAAEARVARLRAAYEISREQLVRLQQRRSAISERASVLDELVRRHEGLSPGVKEVLERAQSTRRARFPAFAGWSPICLRSASKPPTWLRPFSTKRRNMLPLPADAS